MTHDACGHEPLSAAELAEFDQSIAQTVVSSADLAQTYLDLHYGDAVRAVESLAAWYRGQMTHEAVAAGLACLSVRAATGRVASAT